MNSLVKSEIGGGARRDARGHVSRCALDIHRTVSPDRIVTGRSTSSCASARRSRAPPVPPYRGVPFASSRTRPLASHQYIQRFHVCPVPSRRAPACSSCPHGHLLLPRARRSCAPVDLFFFSPLLLDYFLVQLSTDDAASRFDAASTRSLPTRPDVAASTQLTHLALGSGTRICGTRINHSHLALASGTLASGTRIVRLALPVFALVPCPTFVLVYGVAMLYS